MKRLFLVVLSLLCLTVVCPGLVQADQSAVVNTKEINFVLLHGFNGNSSALQLLDDCLEAQISAYITNYEYAHPGVKVTTSSLLRSYPNNVDIDTWANNIADAINLHFAGKNNLVLVGHSMGGKTALYAVSHNIGNIADKVSMVVTINSPVRSLVNYYFVGGDIALDYWGAQKIITNKGVLESLVNYDSSQDGKWVAANKHWMAFISAEFAPLSTQFDTSGVDLLPRVIDDTIVPISCQYVDGADVVYYGEYAHSDFSDKEQISGYMADRILTYIFGGGVDCSVLTRAGAFGHKAGLMPGTDYWEDLVGGVLEDSGTLVHKNASWYKWQDWQDVVGNNTAGVSRSSFQTVQKNSFPLFTGISQVDWVSPDNPEDNRLNLKTRAAPGATVQVDWSIYQRGLLPEGVTRDHYEVEIDTGTQLTSITKVSWETDDSRDVRLRINSQASSPFRWFETLWRVYSKETRQRQIIDEMAFTTNSE
jgi:pimeloyl-ACP methyl ester carboxylesterase